MSFQHRFLCLFSLSLFSAMSFTSQSFAVGPEIADCEISMGQSGRFRAHISFEEDKPSPWHVSVSGGLDTKTTHMDGTSAIRVTRIVELNELRKEFRLNPRDLDKPSVFQADPSDYAKFGITNGKVKAVHYLFIGESTPGRVVSKSLERFPTHEEMNRDPASNILQIRNSSDQVIESWHGAPVAGLIRCNN